MQAQGQGLKERRVFCRGLASAGCHRPTLVCGAANRERSLYADANTTSSTFLLQQLNQQQAGVHLHYRTGWSQAVLHGSVCSGPWKDYPMEQVPSAPGKWMRLMLPGSATTAAQPGSQPNTAKLVEFVLTNKQGDWDKPPDGSSNYIITAPGRYVVSGGAVSSVAGKAVMVVSDLDGTMVGDDAATAAFKQWWEDTAIPRGSVLVYNTGRSLDSFLQLLKDKSHCLAAPDALISAVGTKIYERDTQGSWAEDALWLAQLDEGWSLQAARDACYRALAEVGKDRMHFRPAEEQNSHKVTCGVSAAVIQHVLHVVESNLAAGGCAANVITSGHGQWRYMDIVPVRAGKLAALNHVRRRYSFPVQSTVACGDSGNDILMLQGENPAIIVGNAQPDLREWYQTRMQTEAHNNGPGGHLPRLLLTSRHEALGILEGLARFGFK